MAEKSEGVRRIVFVFSIIAVLSWVIVFSNDSNGFRRGMDRESWLVFLFGIPISYYIPQVITKIIYWVKDGFSQDHSSK